MLVSNLSVKEILNKPITLVIVSMHHSFLIKFNQYNTKYNPYLQKHVYIPTNQSKTN